MTPDPRVSGAIHPNQDQRTLWGRLCRYVLGPVYYWLDLLDMKRRPSHSKVTWTVAFAFALALLVYSAHRILGDADAPSSTELGFLLAFASLTLATAGGLDGFKTWAKSRGGGTVDAFRSAVEAASPAASAPGKAFEEEDRFQGGNGA